MLARRKKTMKYQIIIDETRDEQVLVYSHSENSFTRAVARLCEEDGYDLIGYSGREGVRITPNEVYCFIVEDNKIYALTEKEKLFVKCRLYTLEEALPQSFIKINQSCIANIHFIKRFDISFSGALTVKFKNGYVDYVSRRNLKKVKERLGLK